MNAFVPVTFRDDTVWAVDRAGTVFVAVKPICQNLTIDWNGQYQRLKRDALLSKGMCVINIPSPGGDQETTCLPLNLIPGFLFGIDDRRITDPTVRQKVLAYKLECYDVLFRHFFAPEADDVVAPPAISPAELENMRTRIDLVREARMVYGRAAAREVWQRCGLPMTPSMEIETGAAASPAAIELTELLAIDIGGRTIADAWADDDSGLLDWAHMRRLDGRRCGLWIENIAPRPIALLGVGWHQRIEHGEPLVAKRHGIARRGVFIPAEAIASASSIPATA